MRLIKISDNGLERNVNGDEAFGLGGISFQTSDVAAAGITLGTDNFFQGVQYTRLGLTASANDILPTGTQMETDNPDWAVGVAKKSFWVNNTAFLQTIVGAAGFTTIGPVVIFPAGYTEVMVTHVALNTWTYQQINQDAGCYQGAILKTTNATVAGVTLTAAELRGDVRTRTGPTAAYAETLPLGTAMEADPVFAAMLPGQSRPISLSNQVAFIATWTAATGFTLSGNAAAQPVNSRYMALITKVAVNSYNLEILG